MYVDTSRHNGFAAHASTSTDDKENVDDDDSSPPTKKGKHKTYKH